MKKSIIYLTTLSMSVFCSSCATLFLDSKQPLTFESVPSGATVKIDQRKVGTTPCTIPVKKKYDKVDVLYQKEGFDDVRFDLEKGVYVWPIVLDAPFLLPLVIDGVTANWIKYEDYYTFELEESKTKSEGGYTSSKTQKLLELKKLLDAGALTKEEYEAEKKKILDK